jgi:hypothetical protein
MTKKLIAVVNTFSERPIVSSSAALWSPSWHFLQYRPISLSFSDTLAYPEICLLPDTSYRPMSSSWHFSYPEIRLLPDTSTGLSLLRDTPTWLILLPDTSYKPKLPPWHLLREKSPLWHFQQSWTSSLTLPTGKVSSLTLDLKLPPLWSLSRYPINKFLEASFSWDGPF